jgi:hypothetical protein
MEGGIVFGIDVFGVKAAFERLDGFRLGEPTRTGVYLDFEVVPLLPFPKGDECKDEADEVEDVSLSRRHFHLVPPRDVPTA